MKYGIAILAFAAALICSAAEKELPVVGTQNERLGLSVILFPDKKALASELGSDLGGYYTILQVTLTPAGKEALAISPDDFTLRSHKDGQRAKPLAPSQVAGRTVMVVSSRGGGSLVTENAGPVWGGYPGTGGRPERLESESTAIGNTGSRTVTTEISGGAPEPDDPLLSLLKKRALGNTESSESITGLLYFLLDGKHKSKDLELLYSGPAGRLTVRFGR